MAKISAWVLVVGSHGSPKRIGQDLTKIQENPGEECAGKIVSVDTVTGPLDAIVRVEADDVDKLGRFIVDVIQAVEWVERTTTCLVTHFS